MAPVLDGGSASGTPAYPSSLTVNEMILLLAQQQLQDVTGTTWGGADVLLPYENLGIIEIINLKPEAYPTVQNLILVPGSAQSLPTTALDLVDVVRNMGGDGATSGRIVTSISKTILDYLLPDWMQYTPDFVVRHVIKDGRNPKVFYVFPPQPGKSAIAIFGWTNTTPTGGYDTFTTSGGSIISAINTAGTTEIATSAAVTCVIGTTYELDITYIPDVTTPGQAPTVYLVGGALSVGSLISGVNKAYFTATAASHTFMIANTAVAKFAMTFSLFNAPQQIETVLTLPPTDLTAVDDDFPLDASYKPAIVNYIVFRALSEETTIPNAQAKATTYWNMFLQTLGLKSNVEKQQEEKGE